MELKKVFIIGFSSSIVLPFAVMAEQQVKIEHIEVTAQKRVQSMQEVPVSITAITAEELSRYHLQSADEVVTLSANANATTAAGGMINYYIRGVGMDDFNLSSVSAVGVYIDDIALTNPMASAFSLFDIARVEVLKGPQNTLFGKNTTGGAITFHSVSPTLDSEPEQILRFGIGDNGLLQAEAAVETQLGQQTAVRLSAFSTKRDGIITSSIADNDSQYGNIDKTAIRLQILHQYNQSSQLLVNLHGARQNQVSAVRKVMLPKGQSEQINIADFDIYNIESNLLNPRDDGENLGASIKYSYDFEHFQFNSISAYDRFESQRMDDWSAQQSPSNVYALVTYNSTDTQHFSQEFRWLSTDDESLQWLIGAFYAKDSGDLLQMAYIDPVGPGRADDAVEDAGAGPLFDRGAWLKQNTESFSVYGHAQYAHSDKLNSEFGLRWSRQSLQPTINAVGMMMDSPEQPFPLGTFGWYSLQSSPFDIRRDFAGFDVVDNFLSQNGGPAAASKIDKTFNELGARIGLNYHHSDSLMSYLTLSRGFKMGSVNSNPTTVAFNSLLDKIVEPETLTTLEAGFKSDWLDQTLRINGAVFVNHWQDYQFWLVSNPGPAPQLLATLANVPKAKSTGGELELLYILPSDTTMRFNLGLLDTEITNADVNTSGIPEGNIATYSSQVANGNELTNSPKVNYTLGLGQRFYLNAAELDLSLNYRYIGSHLNQIEGNNSDVWLGNYTQPSINVLDISANLLFGAEQQYQLNLWSKNLFDKSYCTERNAVPASNTEILRLCNQAQPRSFGLALSVSF